MSLYFIEAIRAVSFPAGRKDVMGNIYQELGRQAEEAVRGIKDRELRREAFKILLLQFIAGSNDKGRNGHLPNNQKSARTNERGPAKMTVTRKANQAQAVKRPGRRGGGVATTAIQKLIDGGAFKNGRDAAGIMRELAKKHVILQPSQLRMVLLRFTRTRKLRRRIKMKGKKVTYLYSSK